MPSSPIIFDHHRLNLRRDNGRFDISARKFGNRFPGFPPRNDHELDTSFKRALVDECVDKSRNLLQRRESVAAEVLLVFRRSVVAHQAAPMPRNHEGAFDSTMLR